VDKEQYNSAMKVVKLVGKEVDVIVCKQSGT